MYRTLLEDECDNSMVLTSLMGMNVLSSSLVYIGPIYRYIFYRLTFKFT